MALKTLGTAANNTLSGFVVGTNDLTPADIATLTLSILNDLINGNPVFPGAYGKQGMLFVPNRGILLCRPGDFVSVSPTNGWPILVSAQAAASVDYVHS